MQFLQFSTQERQKQLARERFRNGRRVVILVMLLIITGLLAPQIFLRPSEEKSQHTLQVIHRSATDTLSASYASASGARRVSRRLDMLLRQAALNQQFSGSVLVAQRGQILLDGGYSMADWASQTPASGDTRFYLGSITKEFTAMAVLILQSQGKLHVQDALCTYIPNCPVAWKPLSIHELLTHTSGIPELDDSQLSNVSPAAWIASFANAPLQFTPGGQFTYCNTCYQILAYVVQQVSGLPYSQFIQREIFDPLRMTRSGSDAHAYYSQPNHATGYAQWQVNAAQLGETVDPEWSFLFGSGLLYSTVNDLYRWSQALATDKLVGPKIRDLAFTPYISTTTFPAAQYGYGWFLNHGPVVRHRLIWHAGVIDGFRNYIGRYVDDSTTIIFLGNLNGIDFAALAHQIEEVVFGAPSDF